MSVFTRVLHPPPPGSPLPWVYIPPTCMALGSSIDEGQCHDSALIITHVRLHNALTSPPPPCAGCTPADTGLKCAQVGEFGRACMGWSLLLNQSFINQILDPCCHSQRQYRTSPLFRRRCVQTPRVLLRTHRFRAQEAGQGPCMGATTTSERACCRCETRPSDHYL